MVSQHMHPDWVGKADKDTWPLPVPWESLVHFMWQRLEGSVPEAENRGQGLGDILEEDIHAFKRYTKVLRKGWLILYRPMWTSRLAWINTRSLCWVCSTQRTPECGTSFSKPFPPERPRPITPLSKNHSEDECRKRMVREEAEELEMSCKGLGLGRE